MDILVGIQFRPKDEQLVSFYLKKKVTGQLPPQLMIVEHDLYDGRPPWEVLDPNDQWVDIEGTKTTFHVFTTLKFLGKNSAKKRIARMAGSGTWHGETGPEDIFDQNTGAVVGKKQMFSYVSKDQRMKGSKGHWYMHEYTLAGSSLDDNGGTASSASYVLCKIIRDDRKLLKVEAPSKQAKRRTVCISNQEGGDYEANRAGINPMSTNPLFLDETSPTAPQHVQYNSKKDFLDCDEEEIDSLRNGEEDLGFEEQAVAEQFPEEFSWISSLLDDDD